MSGKRAKAKRRAAEDDALRLRAATMSPPGVEDPLAFLTVQQEVYRMAMPVAILPLEQTLEDVRRSIALGGLLDPGRAMQHHENLAALETLIVALMPFQAAARALEAGNLGEVEAELAEQEAEQPEGAPSSGQ